MGVIYTVACRDCKVARDLQKFYGCRSAKTRAEALELREDLRTDYLFGATLLVSFMAEHKGHNCTVFSDQDEALSEELDPDFGAEVKPDTDFWE